MRYLFVSLAILVLDQWTKWLVLKNMHFAESIPVIDGFFYITSHRNRGAAFGILQNQQWLFIIITLFVIGFILYYLWKGKEEHLLMPVALSLVLGGAVGNLIDRVRFQEVVDFIHFQFGSYTFPLFNIADSAIVIGVILLMIFILKTPPSDEKNVTEARDS
ncbi:signal peptidase II [Thermoflavimicrobium dichotomicum]|uniref:Lipoprotein signal peptidase n=1 Tax=Thermoflavimicrobium dichotomicum TaxID=46223 RepID=A0A1I3SYM4_9BACL|nr:signal peptidase II [Thermoflavimicrobium dichotomicum]SFJ62979.1 signal peptidase II [Thermoflavimicrobium dichotomicum]